MTDKELNELLNRINFLENENKSLRQWQSEANNLMSQMLRIIEDSRDKINSVDRFSKINRYRIDSLPYEMSAPDYCLDFVYPKMMSVTETRKKLVNEKMSIARLGDGEFSAIVGMKRWNFQDASLELGEKLKEVLLKEQSNLLVGLNPNFYRALFDIEESDADGVRAYMRPMVRKLHADYISKDRLYADALFHNISSDTDVAELKEIWNGRDCLFVEGQYTRMGVGNDLFDNARSIQRVLAPSENAFDKYDEILKAVLNQNKDKLCLIALGPTATVLAYALAKEGYQAIDIGHLDLIYEKYSRGLSSLYEVKIPYKYCNSDEIGDKRIIEDLADPEYKQQIICDLS